MPIKFMQVDPDSIDSLGALSARGGIIGPIIKGFLDTGYYMAEVDCAEIGRKASSVSASIAAYAKNHVMPVRPILRGGRLFVSRRDVDKDGKAITDWRDELLESHVAPESVPTAPKMEFESVPLKPNSK